MKMTSILSASLILSSFALATGAAAKGLDELSENAPEEAEPEAEAAPAGEAAAAAPMEKSAASKSIAGKLFVATSYGWAKPSRSEGEWKGSGMSDFTVGYRLASLTPTSGIDGTYRFAPVAVSGQVDENSYRGVWETHYFGGRYTYAMSSTLTAVGTAELGYVMVHLDSADNLEADEEHAKGGAAFAVGGGADWQIFDQGFGIGPRLAVSFGTVSTIQLAGSATFTF